ncbi:MAG: formate dehydrogenase subunit alpha [Limnochordia bacterium]
MYIIIDGGRYGAQRHQTVLDVARENGIPIPTLCHDPRLSTFGACRLCLVEQVENGRLITACTTPVRDGLQVRTQGENIWQTRRAILDLLLSDHPLDCLTCEQGGNCRLQDLAYEYGLASSSFGSKTTPRFSLREDNPFIVMDPDKCILCGKCVRVDHEIQCSYAIDFIGRGFATRVATPFDGGLGSPHSSCSFCGQCVEICPTGALSFRPSRGLGREYQLRRVQTTCPYCAVGCQLILKVKDNRVVQVGSAPLEGTPNPGGETCVKGRFGYGFVNHPERLTKPLVRREGRLVPVPWEEAIARVAEGFQGIKEVYGGQALAGLSSAKVTNEENYLFQKLIRTVFGTNSVDHCARLCHASTVVALNQAFGSGAMTNSIEETELTDVFFIIGANPTENHPVIGSRIRRAAARGAQLIVADPRRIDLAQDATYHLRHRPGTDVALINGIIHEIIASGLENREFIASRTENYQALQESVAWYTPEVVEEITGVTKTLITEAARLYAQVARGAIYFAMGITQHATGVDNVLALANLALVTGHIGRPGTGVNPLRGQNNVQGACDMGALPEFYPGYQRVAENRDRFAQAWGALLPEEEGLTVTEIIDAAGGKIKGLYIMGENPLLSDPDQNHVRRQLARLDFLVVQDIFLTETAQLADVVLPAASFAEKFGTFTNTERRVQLVRRAVDPPGEARGDWQIICAVAQAMGHPWDYRDEGEIMAEIAALTPIYGGIDHQRLEGGGLQWPCPTPEHPGTPYLHKESFTRGKGRFHPVGYRPPVELPDGDYPYQLLTGRMLYHFHTGSMTRRSEPIAQQAPTSYIEINSEDAQHLAIEDGDPVRVISRRGSIITTARVGSRVQPGQVFMPFHYAESPANRLTIGVVDPVAKIPELKMAAVRIEKL